MSSGIRHLSVLRMLELTALLLNSKMEQLQPDRALLGAMDHVLKYGNGFVYLLPKRMHFHTECSA